MSALTIIRLAQPWDTSAQRTALSVLPDLIAAAPATAVIHRGRNTLTRLTLSGDEVVVKAFPAARTLIKRLQRIGRASKAVRAYDHAEQMLRLGIGTPAPLAVVEADDGRAWYVCRFAAGCVTAGAFNRQQGALADRRCAELGRFLGRMHRLGAYHYDSTFGNILVRGTDDAEAEFLVVDCNRMRFGPVSLWAGLRSVVQLHALGRVFPAYCAERGWNPAAVRWLYALRLGWHRLVWWCKDGSRPLRRRLGF